VAVEAVVRRVDLPVGEPLEERCVRVVERLARVGEPIELAGLLEPVRVRILRGVVVERAVLDERVLRELLRRVEALLLGQRLQLALELL